MIKMNLGIIRYRKCVLEPPTTTTTKLKYPSDPAPLAGEKIWIRACMQFSQRRYLYLTPPPPASQLLKYIMLKLHVQGIFIIILVYSIRFGYLWITYIYICQGFYPYRKELWSVTWCILFWFSEELSADRLYGFVAKEQGIFPGVSQDSVFPRKQRANLFYMYWKKQWD